MPGLIPVCTSSASLANVSSHDRIRYDELTSVSILPLILFSGYVSLLVFSSKT